jgi:2-haloacid dehalogenase
MWPAVITFDCYGTLVRWPETLRACFESFLPNGADVGAFHKKFGEIHVELRGRPYRPYTELLRLTLEHTMTEWGIRGVPEAQEKLLQMVHAIPPYPDVVPVLRELKDACRLAIISNTEDELITATVRGLQVPFEVITAEQARAYKPDHRLFAFAFERLGVSAGDVLHVGAGYATDIVPAFELGLPRIWINRRGEQADPTKPPTAELPDLSGLIACIADLHETRAKRA